MFFQQPSNLESDFKLCEWSPHPNITTSPPFILQHFIRLLTIDLFLKPPLPRGLAARLTGPACGTVGQSPPSPLGPVSKVRVTPGPSPMRASFVG